MLKVVQDQILNSRNQLFTLDMVLLSMLEICFQEQSVSKKSSQVLSEPYRWCYSRIIEYCPRSDFSPSSLNEPRDRLLSDEKTFFFYSKIVMETLFKFLLRNIFCGLILWRTIKISKIHWFLFGTTNRF